MIRKDDCEGATACPLFWMSTKNNDFEIGWIGIALIGIFMIAWMWHTDSQRRDKFYNLCQDKLIWSIRKNTNNELGEMKEELISESTLEICRDLYPHE